MERLICFGFSGGRWCFMLVRWMRKPLLMMSFRTNFDAFKDRDIAGAF